MKAWLSVTTGVSNQESSSFRGAVWEASQKAERSNGLDICQLPRPGAVKIKLLTGRAPGRVIAPSVKAAPMLYPSP